MSRLTLKLFGPMEVTLSDGKPLPPTRTRKGLWLLALLALKADRPQSRERLAALLWPETDEASARANLRRALTDLRHVLGPDANALLSPTPATLQLDGSACEIDVRRFDADPQAQWALCRGALLEGCHDDWAEDERRTREETYLETRLTLARAAPPKEAIGHLEAVLHRQPLRESAVRALIEALRRDGRAREAQGVYRKLAQSLGEQRLTPEPETRALFEALPQKRSSPPRLPAPLTSFIGRDGERATLVAQLAAGTRLITLLGPGGAGKTRLALEVARTLEPTHLLGVVDCSAVTDADALPAALLRHFDLRVSEAAEQRRRLEAALRHGALFLDNLEQVGGSPATVLSSLLERCPGLQLVATSRLRLHLPGEFVLRLGGLPASDAAALFTQRALAAGASPAHLHEAALESLCARLDGLPLALELAAAWCDVLTPEEIVARLDARFALLTGGDGRRGLEAALCWSWERLPRERQEELLSLSLLPGAFSLGAGAAALGLPGDEPRVLRSFQALADASWLVALPGGPTRYRLLESIRLFVQARTTPTTNRQTRGRLWQLWERRAQTEADDTGHWMDVIHHDLESLRVILDDADGQPERGLDLLVPASVYFDFRGMAAECSERMEQLLAALPPGATRKSHWLWTLAGSALWLQEYERARAALEEALERDTGSGRAYLLGTLGVCLRNLGERERAEACHREALELHVRYERFNPQCVEQMRLGVILRERGAWDDARSAFEVACQGDAISRAGALAEWARLERTAGDTMQSEALYDRSLQLHRELGNLPEIEKLESERAT